jgi:hypothetical protein
MFSEYRDLVAQLKASDPRFLALFDQHDALDQQIRNMEAHVLMATHQEIETAKKQKLLLKDQVYTLLRKASASSA